MKHLLLALVCLSVLWTGLLAQPIGETDPFAIHKDGTSTTTAIIPFAVGWSQPDSVTSYLGTAAGSRGYFEKSGSALSLKTEDSGTGTPTNIIIEPGSVNTDINGARLDLFGGANLFGNIGGPVNIQGGAGAPAGNVNIDGGAGSGATIGGIVFLRGGSSGLTRGYVSVGTTGTPNRFSLTSDDARHSLYVTKALEVDGATWLDGGVTLVSLNITADSNQIVLDSDGTTTTLTDSATAARTITFPDATTTLAGLAVNQTFTQPQKINTNSTNAFFVEQDGVKDNVFIVDTTNGAVGIGRQPVSGNTLHLTSFTNTDTAVRITGLSSQSGNLLEVEGSSASDYLRVMLSSVIEPDHNVRVGPNPSASTPSVTTDRFTVSMQGTSTSGPRRAILATSEFQGTSNSSANWNAGIFIATDTAAATGNITSTSNGGGLVGGRYRVTRNGSGTLTRGTAISTQVQTADFTTGLSTDLSNVQIEAPSLLGGLVTNYMGIHQRTATVNSTAATNWYGLRIEAMSGTSTRYQIGLDGTGSGSGIYFNTPTAAGTEYVRAGATGVLQLGANTTLRARMAGLSTNAFEINSTNKIAMSDSYAPLSSTRLYVTNRIVDPAAEASYASQALVEVFPLEDWAGGDIRGFHGSVNFDDMNLPGADFNNGAALIGLDGSATVTFTTGSVVNNVNGLFGEMNISGAGTVSNAIAVNTLALFQDNATVTVYKSMQTRGPSLVTGATVGTQYGLYAEEMTTATNNYEVFLAGGGGIFLRDVGTQIYSSAANTLDYDANSGSGVHIWRVGGTEEMRMAANALTFDNGANDVVLGWATNDQLEITAGATLVSGTLRSSRTSDLGWSVVDGTDNTACTSQCTSAAVFGFALVAGVYAAMVGPSDATADICVCAGAS